MNPTMKLMSVAIASVAVMMIATIGFGTTQTQNEDGLRTFSNDLELRLFLTRERPDHGQSPYQGVYSPGDSFSRLDSSESYSTTNIQVAGVDEDDIVKSDGEYIYIASSTNVTIVKAYPPELLQKVSVIEIAGLAVDSESHQLVLNGIFVNDDKLILIVSAYTNWYRYYEEESVYEPPKSIIAIYDIGDRANPSFIESVAVSGSSLSARMIGECVYLVSQAAIWADEYTIQLPSTWKNDTPTQMKATDIRFDPDTKQAGSFLNVLSVDINTGEHELLSVVAGWATVVYMSPNTLYFTIQKYESTIEWIDGEATPIDSSSAITTIYKVDVDSLTMSLVASGNVNGWLLDQFSMDEHGSNLRVATTTEWADLENAVYVLDDDLSVIGMLEGLAPTERIYSSRFIGDTLYLVTFRQIDPLFVIDLKDPTAPAVVGELKIPGFSTYLHPVGESHVLGIGLENGVLKISLFNVTDPANPQEQSKYLAQQGWYTVALYDHKAVLFDLERELLVIPGYSYSYQSDPYEYTYSYTSGALVFRVSVSDGISLVGIATNATSDGTYRYETYSRSLYIGDYLFTISESSVLVHQLDDLSFVSRLIYNEKPYDYYSSPLA